MSTQRNSPVLDMYESQGEVGVRDDCRTHQSYSAVEAEHQAIRTGIGLVDYSAYGKFVVRGPAALELVNRVVMADVARVPIRRMVSTPMLREDGTLLCDAHVANLGEEYLLLTEGAPADHVVAGLRAQAALLGGVEIVDRTRESVLFGLDGPYAWELLRELAGMSILSMRYLEVMVDESIGDIPVALYRAGKTGEFGYWIHCDSANAHQLWKLLLQAGRPFNLVPCGYAAIDLCRLENRFLNPLREGTEAENALELNCRILVSSDKGEYIGKPAIDRMLASGPRRRMIGLLLSEKAGLPEPGTAVAYREQVIGQVVSAGHSFTLNRTIALALLDVEYAYVGLDYELRADGQSSPARTVSSPFILTRSLSVRPQEDSYQARARS